VGELRAPIMLRFGVSGFFRTAVACFAAYNEPLEAWSVPKHLFTAVSLVLTLLPQYTLAAISSRHDPVPTAVLLRSIIFSKPIVLSPGEIRDLTRTFQSQSHQFLLATESEKFADHADALTQLAYQDHGYFLAKATSEVIPVKSNSGPPQVDLFVSVNEGHQYRLLDLGWKNISRFSEQQLVDLMPVHPGEIFSRSKIAKGLDEARKLYRSHGYINFTCIPNTVFDEAQHDVALEIEVDEGGAFHWGDLHVEGMSEPDKRQLLRGWEDLRGQVYGSSPNHVLNTFFTRYFRPLRRGVTPADYARWKIDQRACTVDVYLSLESNPSLPKQIPKSWRLSPASDKSNP
jgi:hypothetical protein